jgi:SAM-dependent methyltransferase
VTGSAEDGTGIDALWNRELELLDHAGVDAVVIRPTAADRDAMGPDPMSSARADRRARRPPPRDDACGMSQLEFDEDAARRIEAMYLIRDAARRRRIVRAALAARPGERILDVGCGPGFYCAELLEEVGPSGRVVGLDASPAMLALAERRCGANDKVELRAAEAGALPVEDASFDGAVTVQVQEYVADVGASLAELHRALRPGGRLVVFDIDWATLSVNADDHELSARVLGAWDEHLAHVSLPRTLAARLRAAGFDDVRMEAYAFATSELDPETYGGALVPFIGNFVAGRQGLTPQDAERWVDEQRALGERGEFFFSITQFCFAARKPAGLRSRP